MNFFFDFGLASVINFLEEVLKITGNGVAVEKNISIPDNPFLAG